MLNKKAIMLLTFTLLLFAGCGRDTGPDAYEPDPDMWRLIWSDEFDGDALDLSVWEIMTGTGAQYGLTGWGNNEAQYYHGDNITVSGGNLRIEARRQTRSSRGEGSRQYTSGRIRSTGTQGHGEGISVLYGRIEARIKLPAGDGLWPAFWMLPTDSPYGGWPLGGEIDIMEGMGRRPYRSTAAIHFGRAWPNNTHTHGAYTFPEGQSIEDFHVYAVEWEPGVLRWYVNEHLFWTQTSWWSRHPDASANYIEPAPFDQPFHILLNLAIGGHFDPEGTANLNPEIFPVAMYVDYVRVYELIGREMQAPPVPITITERDYGKAPLPDGNHIWNGTFDQGDGLLFWHTHPGAAEMGITARPVGESGINLEPFVRRFYVENILAGSEREEVMIWQSYTVLRDGVYRLAFTAQAAAPRSIEVRLADLDGHIWHSEEVLLNTDTARHEIQISLQGMGDGREMQVQFLFGGHSAGVTLGDVGLKAV